MVLDKIVWTKWYGHQSRFQFDTFSFPLCAHNLFVTFGYSIYIEFNGFHMLTKYKIVPFCPYHFVHTILSNSILSVYHFVHTILSVPFCPLPFCPVTLRSALSESGWIMNEK